MPTVFFIAGLLITIAGVVMIFLARFERPQPPEEETGLDVKAVLEQLNWLLKLVEQRYRIGVILVAVGLVLVGVGAWLEAREAKEDVKQSMAVLVEFV